jgi:murein DD-endopeptidase MepM/ murein hydrolase activator NlpD
MAISTKNHFWLVSRVDGQVQKYRLRLDRLSILFAMALSVVVAVAFIAGVDYGKGLTWIRGHFSQNARNEALQAERVKIARSNLRQKARALSEKEARLKRYNKELVQRLGELSSLLKKASDYGVVQSKDFKRLSLRQTELHSLLENSESGAELLEVIADYAQTIRFIPIGSPVEYSHISSGFGYRNAPYSGVRKLHTGIDLSARYGSKVKATADGIVKAVKRMSGYGLIVDIQHGPGVVTRYAHLSAATVRLGQRVMRGEQLGLVGMTGRSTGPHLHYELIVSGKPQSPHVLLEMFDRFKPEILTASLPIV